MTNYYRPRFGRNKYRSGTILVRGDSAYGTRSVVTACLRAKVEFSVVMAKNTAVARAIDSIADETWTPVKYPGAVRDPDTVPGFPMPRSPKPLTPLSLPARTRSPPG